MPFGSLSGQQRITILMAVKGAAQYISSMTQSAVASARLANAQEAAAASSKKLTQRTFLQQQALFTLRRYTFYATLATTALGIGVAKLGLTYYNTMQTASVAFKGILGSQRLVNKELHTLYLLAAKSPFEFPDIVIAARRLQPFTKDIRLTNQLINSTINSLSAMGILTGSALNRASLALSHMFAVGRLTGQILYQLSRDNIPMVQALEKYYNLTGLAIKQKVAAGLVDARTAAIALNRYTSTDPAFRGAAFQQATKTLTGAWSTLKDLIGMSAAGSEGGVFDGVRKAIQGIDQQLIKVAQNKGTMNLTNLVTAIDQQFSPRTHLILNFFIILSTALKTVVFGFGALLYAIQQILRPFDYLNNMFGLNIKASKLLGYYLGILIILMGINTVRTFALAESFALLRKFVLQTDLAMAILNTRLGYAAFGFALTNAAMLGWIGLAILIIATLVILYLKWKKFHDLVDMSFKWIRQNSTYIAIAIGAAFLPILIAAEALKYIIDNFQKIKSFVKTGLSYAGPNHSAPDNRTPQQKARDLKNQGKGNWFSRTFGNIIMGAFATGGTAYATGPYLVGERGPEIVNLGKGATVTPMDNSAFAGSLHIMIIPQDIYFDRQKIGTIVAQVKTSREARKTGSG